MFQLYGHCTPNGLITRVPPVWYCCQSGRDGMTWAVWGQSAHEGFSSYRESSARVSTKGLDSGPLVVHNGEHQTNSMVVIRHSSQGRNFGPLIRGTRPPALLH
ncbi:hypothetical protein TIFTF001_007959 [Ficus carica]|uniref:Uncharacterized protein n=1 Tax=Ficus carica TaxID=3494 RepID=A0AA87ZU16_FICCA|nr:hypothetical protein TIFTF001_007959 [Ficus carica]